LFALQGSGVVFAVQGRRVARLLRPASYMLLAILLVH